MSRAKKEKERNRKKIQKNRQVNQVCKRKKVSREGRYIYREREREKERKRGSESQWPQS